jgi:hypothetical protein
MTADSERQIRELLETRTRAFGRRDATTAAAGYDNDLVLYDAIRSFVHEHASVPFDADTGHAVLRGELR